MLRIAILRCLISTTGQALFAPGRTTLPQN